MGLGRKWLFRSRLGPIWAVSFVILISIILSKNSFLPRWNFSECTCSSFCLYISISLAYYCLMTKPPVTVLVVMGSEKDADVMSAATEMLCLFGVSFDVQVVSAHRTPARCRALVTRAVRRGTKVIIAAAGKAAHLAGVIASYTTVPVIGVPLDAGLAGLDALLSTVQMPAGVPVATVAIGRSGAANAGLLAVEILALSDQTLARKLVAFRKKQAADVARQSREVQAKLGFKQICKGKVKP